MNKSLLTEYPMIAKEWNYSRNDLGPEKYAPHSNKKVWWYCSNGHKYEAVIDKRTARGQGCPFCSSRKVNSGVNDFATLMPELLKDWDYEKNIFLPSNVLPHSNKVANWACSRCGYKWIAKINDRTNGRGCPKCSAEKRIKSFRENNYLIRGKNDLETLYPKLAEEWDIQKNGDIKPSDFTCHSKTKVFWKCSICGNSWAATIKNRADNQSGCPKCMKYQRTSFPEQALYYYIKSVYPDTINSYTEIFNRNRELDIFIPDLKAGIEYDGKAWHKGNINLKKSKEKYDICQKEGIRLIRISESPQVTKTTCDDYIFREDISEGSLDRVILTLFDLIGISGIDVNVNRDRAEIMKQYVVSLQNKSIEKKYPELTAEWALRENSGLSPSMVNAFSAQKYWWRCEKGHLYKMSPVNKIQSLEKGYSCPVCSGHQLLSGYNDLATRYPEIAIEWDDKKNAPVKAFEVMPGSVKKYWWKCEKGHSYLTTPNQKTSNNSGCPYCSGKQVFIGFNDITTVCPDLADKWDYEANTQMKPSDYSVGSSIVVGWKCSKNHTWRKKISSQYRYNSCPICTNRECLRGVNDLLTTNPEIAAEWDYDKNYPLSPTSVTSSYSKKVWWICSKCNNRWQSIVRTRAKAGTECPNCCYEKTNY